MTVDLRWRIRMLGEFSASLDGRVLTRFQSQKAGALLAYLAYFGERDHPRERLLDTIWSGQDLEAARNGLRVALSYLRRDLERPYGSAQSVLAADRVHVRLLAGTFSTDAAEFQRAAQEAAETVEEPERLTALTRAVDIYTGDLLPDSDDAWVLSERERLRALYHDRMGEVIRILAQRKELERAMAYARKAVADDAIHEGRHRDLMRLCAALGRPQEALTHFRRLERILRDESEATPAPATRKLAEDIAASVKQNAGLCAGHVSTSGRTPRAPDDPGPPNDAGVRTLMSLIPTPASRQALAPGRNRTGMPQLPGKFFGREPDIAHIRELLEPQLTASPDISDPRPRLITLTGPGGAGKTRLAIRISEDLLRERLAQVRWAPLADLADSALALDCILRAWGAPADTGADPLEALLQSSPDEAIVLVLDNLEHLLTADDAKVAAKELVDRSSAPDNDALSLRDLVALLLDRIPRLTVIATSRQPLGIAGEHEVAVMSLPTPGRPGTPERLLEFPSIQLFVDRARLIQRDFSVTRSNAAAVADLCSKLDGIPLAIELAAAWVKTMAPAQILGHFSETGKLESRTGAESPRHRSLGAAIESSFRLLNPALQTAFRRLSVFRGGWTLEAAAHICFARSDDGGVEGAGLPSPGSPSAPVSLGGLQDRSLILLDSSDSGPGGARYRMLETVREFAYEQVPRSERSSLESRHAEYFLSMAVDAEPRLETREQLVWLDRLESEHDNIRAALLWHVSSGDGEGALRLSGALAQFWNVRGYAAEGRQWLERAMRIGGATEPAVRARAHWAYGLLAFGTADVDLSEEHYQTSLQIYRELEDVSGIARVTGGLYMVASFRDEFDRAIAMLEDSLSRCRAAAYSPGIADGLRCLGNVRRNIGQFDEAEALYEQSQVIYREMGDMYRLATLLSDYGFMLSWNGDLARAQRLYEESLDLCTEMKDRAGIAHRLWLIGEIAARLGEGRRAVSLFEESLAVHRELGNRLEMIWVMGDLAFEHKRQGEWAAAYGVAADRLSVGREIRDRKSNLVSLELLAHCAAMLGDPLAARSHLGERLALARAMDRQRDIAIAAADIALWHALRGDLAQSLPKMDEATRSLSAPDTDRAVAHVLAVGAVVAVAEGDHQRAAVLFGAAESHRDSRAFRPELPGSAEYLERITRSRNALTDGVFEQLFQEGRAMDLNAAISFASSSGR